jgi:hypothetical protein
VKKGATVFLVSDFFSILFFKKIYTMIQSIDIAKLRNPEYIEFSQNFLSIIALNNPGVLKVLAEFNAFEGAVQEIEGLFKTDQGSNFTPVIEALDIRRDTAIMGIFKCADGYTHHFNPVKQEAGTVLLNQLKVYGTATSVTNSNLPSETTMVRSLVSDCTTKPPVINAIKELGMEDWVAELQAANNLLAQNYVDRSVELGNNNPGSIRDKRLEANTLYYALRDMLQAQAIVAKNAVPYPQVINSLNGSIERYNLILAGRGTTTNNGETQAAIA